ncbi:MAG: glutamate racemase [Alphaproteobacteria bacterium]|nr:glutamate racemase [Alphaproteobacteria bacterium]
MGMTIGIFDSGLGGLIIAKAIRSHITQPDMVYFGDTLHIPYGNRSAEAIYDYSCRAMDYLFNVHDCALVIVACNTVSACALRRLQQEYLIRSFPEKRILGVVVPTLECAIEKGYKNIGLIGTNRTILTNVYEEELQKINPEIQIHQINTPLLVPMIENEGMQWIDKVLEHYLEPLLEKNIECLILGCTHYAFLKERVSAMLGHNVDILSQDEIIPAKLESYLEKHTEITERLSRDGQIQFFVSDITPGYQSASEKIYGNKIEIHKTELCTVENKYK